MNFRARVVSAQFSANNRRSQEPSFCGALPQYTAVGTSNTSRNDSPRKSSTIASR
jgi:hypothetical protein